MSMVIAMHNNPYSKLREDGFCVFKNILPKEKITELQSLTDRMVAQRPKDELNLLKYQGSDIHITIENPILAKLITWNRSLEALGTLGFKDPKFFAGTIISKPPHSPALYWHQDWSFWNQSISAGYEPPQLFLMYYLVNTTRENGCLRVIPKTHHQRIPFHDQLPEAHSMATYKADPSSPAFYHHPDEVDIMVEAGDLVIGDARVSHAAHPNVTDNRRTVITLWYFPQFDLLPDSIKSACKSAFTPIPLPSNEFSVELCDALSCVIPQYRGNADPAQFSCIPREHLKYAEENLATLSR